MQDNYSIELADTKETVVTNNIKIYRSTYVRY